MATTMKKMNIKKGDNVMVIAGDDKGTSGRVLEVYPEKNTVLVEGVNIHKKHARPSGEDQQGGIKEISLPVNYSNLQLVDSEGKATRIRSEVETGQNGRKIKKRIAVTNGKEI